MFGKVFDQMEAVENFLWARKRVLGLVVWTAGSLVVCPGITSFCNVIIGLVWVGVLLGRVSLMQAFAWRFPFMKGSLESRSAIFRILFEMEYTLELGFRVVTCPFRVLPNTLVIGANKAGTTTISQAMGDSKYCLGLAGDGSVFHGILDDNFAYLIQEKESHYLCGKLGRNCGSSAMLYRSFFPTVFYIFYYKISNGIPLSKKLVIYDADPMGIPAMYYSQRMAKMVPDAKLILSVRDPAARAFSHYNQDISTGVFMEKEDGSQNEFEHIVEQCMSEKVHREWEKLDNLGPEEPLPENLISYYFNSAVWYLHGGRYDVLVDALYKSGFKSDQIEIVDFSDIKQDSAKTMKTLMGRLGIDDYTPLEKASNVGTYGFRMNPETEKKLRAYYAPFMTRFSELTNRTYSFTPKPTKTATQATKPVNTSITTIRMRTLGRRTSSVVAA